MSQKRRFYIYGLFYKEENNNICFYIGKGTRDRYKQHFQKSKKTHNPHKSRKIKKLEAKNKEVFSKKLVENLTNREAYKLEERLLNKNQIFDNVTNITKGINDKNHPLKRKELTKEHKNNIGEAQKGEQNTESKLTRKKVSEIKWLLENTKIYITNITKEYPVSRTSIKNIKQERTWSHISETQKTQKVVEIVNKYNNYTKPSAKGEKNGSNKLSKEQAGEIKWMSRNTDLSDSEIATHYPVSECSITDIRRGDTWSHISVKEP